MSENQVDGRTLRYQHRRPELLQAATRYVLDHGVGDLTLRSLAPALGVSHVTVMRHFGTVEALLTEILTAMLAEFRAWLRSLDASETDSGAELLRAVWRHLCRPEAQRQFLLLFELAAATRQATDPPTIPPQALVHDGLDVFGEALVHHGWPPDTAAQAATLILAQIRGLQIDLLITADRRRVDQAFEMLLTMLVEAGLDRAHAR
ncbi:TetR/AcrR family transcriptional regulator [Nocardia sp. CDC159]|uniref:TetR/AcrR family transcriptional regulator n=1 Tax=Nocardia pulmonis TaxID=2951408 RepID=A0A9X2J2Z5_9NOCA|nr:MULTISPECIES: TetR/AcrR family transcriptional regulator [Nocardia]MCM6778556.1 TetR/AcrR family transcriptional regulator [Nocardia pulmonis]MCM6791445.1 TetR/AcrR family transcriptional regulator [Nocardia sp. CDC159]